MKNRLVTTFALVSVFAGTAATGIGAYESLEGHINDKEGKAAVTECIDNNQDCTLEQFKDAAAFSTQQDRAGEKILAGSALFLSATALFMAGAAGGSGTMRTRRQPPKPPQK